MGNPSLMWGCSVSELIHFLVAFIILIFVPAFWSRGPPHEPARGDLWLSCSFFKKGLSPLPPGSVPGMFYVFAGMGHIWDDPRWVHFTRVIPEPGWDLLGWQKKGFAAGSPLGPGASSDAPRGPSCSNLGLGAALWHGAGWFWGYWWIC